MQLFSINNFYFHTHTILPNQIRIQTAAARDTHIIRGKTLEEFPNPSQKPLEASSYIQTAQRFLEKVGFRKEGTVRGLLLVRGGVD
jgi:hypothetical protein